MTDELVLSVTNQLSEIARITRSVEAFADRQGLSAHVRFAVNFALEELVVNAISYGYREGGSGDHHIDITVTVDGGLLMARLEDDGCPFDPTAYPAPDTTRGVEDRKIGGLGIHLVRGLFDTMEYRRSGERNVLVMKKSL
jgi:anti-sigma regulatory factor (Ser/Thr protein kinase)